MKVVVAGGTGFLGRHLIERLRGRGDEVIVLSRRPAGQGERQGVFVAWDPYSGPAPGIALAGAQAVVNLMGEPIIGRWTAAKKRRIRDSRIAGTRNLVAGIAAASPAPKVLVNGSATGYYGPHGDEELDESAPPSSDFLGELCREWEAEAVRARDAGVRVVMLRTGIVLGREGGALKSMLPPFRLGLGGRIGSGRQWMPWIHVDDLIAMIVHALDRSDLEGPINGTAPHPVRNADFTRALGRALRRPAVLPAPAFALRILLGEVAEFLLTGQRVLPRRALETGFRFTHTEIDGALASLL